VADAGGLLKVHTFCLDTNTLTTQQEDSLKKVLAGGSKSKGALTKLNWKLLDSCESADATVTMKMEEHEESVPTGDNGSVGGPPEARQNTIRLKSKVVSQAKMSVADRASGTMLYRADGAERDNEVSAFESPFIKLSKDVTSLSQ
jgi:hypothetical protein